MFQLGNKILPISSSKKCCICLEVTKRYKKCPNDKCTDGIYCLTCLNKMTLDQKKRCSICRQETNFIEKNKKIKIIVKKDSNQNINKKKNYCQDFICILFFIICCLLLSFTIGLIIFSSGDDISFVAKTCSPVILIIVGGIIVLLVGCCCLSFIYFLKENLCKNFSY